MKVITLGVDLTDTLTVMNNGESMALGLSLDDVPPRVVRVVAVRWAG